MEAREERQLMRMKGPLAKLDLLILDELGYVPASKLGAELLFDVISTAYERTSVMHAGTSWCRCRRSTTWKPSMKSFEITAAKTYSAKSAATLVESRVAGTVP